MRACMDVCMYVQYVCTVCMYSMYVQYVCMYVQCEAPKIAKLV